METRTELHDAIELLDDKQVREVAAIVERLLDKREDAITKALGTIPGVRLPLTGPHASTGRAQPVEIAGELGSEQLIRERR